MEPRAGSPACLASPPQGVLGVHTLCSMARLRRSSWLSHVPELDGHGVPSEPPLPAGAMCGAAGSSHVQVPLPRLLSVPRSGMGVTGSIVGSLRGCSAAPTSVPTPEPGVLSHWFSSSPGGGSTGGHWWASGTMPSPSSPIPADSLGQPWPTGSEGRLSGLLAWVSR